MLDNVVWHANSVCRGFAFDQDRVPIAITPGEHRLMVKVFEGGGGFDAAVRFVDLFTGEPIIPPVLTISVEPTEMTEVPPPPEVTATRQLPCAAVAGEPVTVTIQLDPADVAVDIYELILPPWSEPTNYGAGLWDPVSRILAWPGAVGSVSYDVVPSEGVPPLLGVIDTAAGLVPIGGRSGVLLKRDLGGGWYGADIGNPALPGSEDLSEIESGCMEVTGDGADIWGTSDQFHFVWREVSGNYFMEAVCEAWPAPGSNWAHEWAKAGLMIRASCDANSAYATCQWRQGPQGGSPGYVAAMRDEFGGNARDTGLREPVTFPHWGRIVKIGGHVWMYFSTDHTTWELRGEMDLPDEDGSDTFLVGLYATSHNSGAVSTARFCQISYGALPGCVTGLTAEVQDGTVVLTWQNQGAYDHFTVYRRAEGEADWTEIGEAEGSAENFTDSAPPAGAPVVEYRLQVWSGPDGDILICEPEVSVTLNQPPSLSVEPPSAELQLCAETVSLTLTATAEDPEGDELTFSWSATEGATIEAAGNQATATFNAIGNYTVTCTVTDGYNTVSVDVPVSVIECQGIALFIGDANCSGEVDIADAICILTFLFGSEGEPCKTQCCAANEDTNADDAVDIADAIKVLSYLFAGDSMIAPDGAEIQPGEATCEVYPRGEVELPCATPCMR